MLTANNSPDASTPDSAITSQEKPIQKAFSCALCAQRKVKCDKAPGGCSNCTKARVECIYKAPPPPRRRKKGQRARELDVQSRLRLYEKTLRAHGIDPEELVGREEEGTAAAGRSEEPVGVNKYVDDVRASNDQKFKGDGKTRTGVLVTEGGKSRYLENTLWTSLQSEFRDPKRILEDSSDEEEVELTPGMSATSRLGTREGDALLGASFLGSSKAPGSLRAFHPSPGQIFKLWQIYLDNINPLIKVFHAPSVQQIISNASGNLDEVPKNVECLMFCIFATALESLGNSECIAILGQPKDMASKRFKTAGHLALIRSSFLKTSDPIVLQALVLYNTSLINFDARVVWILTGVAARIGQRIGLHRDPETLGLPPFECEMRRRLWFQIMMQDGFAQKLAGTGGTMFFGEVKRPSNLNDSDLFPDMKELPPEHHGATEMMFFLIRCHLGEFVRHFKNPSSSFDGVWNPLSGDRASLEAKDKAIDELEVMYQRKFLDHCDRSIPWHFMCTYLAKGVVAMLRFIAHCPDATDAKLPQTEKDLLFEWAVSVVRWQNMAYTTKEMQGCLWHINSHFQWKAFVYFVSALKYRTQGPEVDKAWKEVQTVFDFHPNFSTQASRKALPIAVATLTLTSWDAYIAARGIPKAGEPPFIQVLRARKAKPSSKSANGIQAAAAMPLHSPLPFDPTTQPSFVEQQDLPPTGAYAEPVDTFQWDASLANTFDGPQLGYMDVPMQEDQSNWSNWDNLMLNFELQKANSFAVDGGGFGMMYDGGGSGPF
ncbi:hypothetical protein P171DRAFT_435880 [Karstenula rhodostoma CBS 690.94]|uniref:Zn(2)-C6 fungal-type domain-containing protein n=1 Tax=Karstenula rhodostoma CBS 690.94 TaxID=1392251 RepID=A0A9P4PA03_9PLEO|nr:hypothetical protein P171DRAFT_435880 [Karstenula rhodostoma CBS 690.94]